MPPLSLDQFASKHNLTITKMTIDDVVSPYPRTIQLPQCPKCENYLFLYHPLYKRDPFISKKTTEGVLSEKVGKVEEWLMACWTLECEFYLVLKAAELAICPECNKHYAETYSLFDHMRFQCTTKAADRDTIIKAGAGEYLQELSLL
jgi:ssDNA-binding Zn-finger/Zn-ribbon topoisomerase 1